MLLKATVLGCAALVSTPICYVTLQDKDCKKEKPAAVQQSKQRESKDAAKLRRKIARLEAAIEKLEKLNVEAQREAGEARIELSKLRAQLDSALDLVENSTKRVAHRNCTPSRSRKILTYYQWFEQNGHEKRADRMITQVIKETGTRNSSLNSLAWHLLTERGTAGSFDRAALAVAERMEKNGRLRHNEYDTLALAKFMNGKLKEAVALQHQALRHSNSSECRRRLRVYEAALRQNATTQQRAAALAAAGGQ